MAKSSVLVLSLLSALGLLAGCAPGAPVSQPTYSCTPEAGGTPFPCAKVQRDEYDKLDALYAEAEAVYRKYLAEDERIWRAGGVDQATPAIQETLTGEALSTEVAFYKTLKQADVRLDGGKVELSWMRRVPDEVRPGMVVALQVCVDQHTALMVSKGETPESAGYFSDTANFVRDEGRLKIARLYQPASGEVEAC